MPEPNLTMVAFHGTRKPEPLRSLLQDVLRVLGSKLPRELARSFEPYTMTQMHATLIGMEADLIEGRLYGRWFRKNRRESREISVDQLHSVITERIAAGRPLFTIRFGGFPECFCTCRTERREACGQWACATAPQELGVFHSCDRSPYEGSFYAAAPGPGMITGWPVAASDELHSFTHGLYELRQSLEQAGFADKYHYDSYHEHARWKNDDCFIRIGTFRDPIPLQTLRAVQQDMRIFFSNTKPVVLDIAPEDVSIIWYAHPSLEERHVIARIPLPVFVDDPSSLKRLYGAALDEKGEARP